MFGCCFCSLAHHLRHIAQQMGLCPLSQPCSMAECLACMHAAAMEHSHAAMSIHIGIQKSHHNVLCILAHYLHENSAGSSAHHLDGACTYSPAQNLSLSAGYLFTAVLSLLAVRSFAARNAACRRSLWFLLAVPTMPDTAFLPCSVQTLHHEGPLCLLALFQCPVHSR